MADLSDVVDAVAALLASAFYPDGPCCGSALDDTDVTVIRGWPLPANLDRALAPKTGLPRQVCVSVFPPPNLERATTRVLSQWLRVAPPARSLTVTIAGDALTLGGAIAVPQNVGLTVNGRGYVHVVQAGDTLAGVATALAALLAADGIAAQPAGPTLTVPQAYGLVARVGSVTLLAKEVERTQRAIMTTIWAPTLERRTAAGRIVRARLSTPKFLDLCDGSAAWVVYDRTNDSDINEKVAIYRRDLTHWFEFGQYDTIEATEIVVAQVGTTVAIPPRDPLATTTITAA